MTKRYPKSKNPRHWDEDEWDLFWRTYLNDPRNWTPLEGEEAHEGDLDNDPSLILLQAIASKEPFH